MYVGLYKEFRMIEKAMIEVDSWSNQELLGFKAALRDPCLDMERIWRQFWHQGNLASMSLGILICKMRLLIASAS